MLMSYSFSIALGRPPQFLTPTCQNIFGVALVDLGQAIPWPPVQQLPKSPPTSPSSHSGSQARERRGHRERRSVLVALWTVREIGFIDARSFATMEKGS